MSLDLREQKIDLLKPKGNQILQKTYDEDINVPDIKPDMDKVLQTNAQIYIKSEELLLDKVILHGELRALILYKPLNDKKPIHSMDITIPFEEIVNVDGLSSKDSVNIHTNIEDLNIHLLNSRKLNLKGILTLNIDAFIKDEVYLTSDIESGRNIEKKINQISLCKLKESKKENYKIKDELPLPSGKPNIMEILWHDITIQNKDIKLIDGKINLKGNVHVATLYFPEDGEGQIEFVENDLSFNGLIECQGCTENMVNDVQIKIIDDKIQIRPDLDGEERVLSVEVDTIVDIKVYEEEQTNVLSDVYSLEKELLVKRDSIDYQKLLCKNQSQINLKESVLIDDVSNEILQIYYGSGNCVVEDIQYFDDKVNMEGVLFCKIMYLAADDNLPINIFEVALPFEQNIDIKGLNQNSVVNISPNLNYMGCTMIGDREIEVRATIQMNVLAFEQKDAYSIISIEEKPLDMKSFQGMPGIVGYIVKEKESLWDIAKKYMTTTKSIKRTNALENDDIKKGDKLIIIKEML